ncbi:MAG: hypothetical protein D4R84_16940 [Rhodocyclaceae bacterium]|nr:MAG: hypothetical protein D4R84_16940 [Rhodocyclaceae bacterium]
MDQITVLDTFRNPFGNQEIELQEVRLDAGGIPMLRIRIRERGARFTVFDMDPVTAQYWAGKMAAWATATIATVAATDTTDAP